MKSYHEEYYRMNIVFLMNKHGQTYPQMAKSLTSAGYAVSANNVKTYLQSRKPSVELAIALTNVFDVSMEELLCKDLTRETAEGFDRDFCAFRYRRYEGTYTVYFISTDKNADANSTLTEGRMDISYSGVTGDYRTKLTILTQESNIKCFEGTFILSNTSDSAFIVLLDEQIGEITEIIFNAANLNQPAFHSALGAAVSVSSGASQKMPTLHRVYITRNKIKEEFVHTLKAYLALNTKYISIDANKLEKTIHDSPEKFGLTDVSKALCLLKNAFPVKTYHEIEEQYIYNTFKNEMGISETNAQELIVALRLADNHQNNSKVNPILDERLYVLLNDLDALQI